MRDVFDEEIGKWHEGASPGKPLHEHLGMTWEEYAWWATHGEVPERMREEFAFVKVPELSAEDQRVADIWDAPLVDADDIDGIGLKPEDYRED